MSVMGDTEGTDASSGAIPGTGEHAAEPVICEIIIHPAGGLDDAQGSAQFWAEIPILPDCGGIAARTPDEVFALTVAQVDQWRRSRHGAPWQPVPWAAAFVAVHAW
jgi:hypothetical protein